MKYTTPTTLAIAITLMSLLAPYGTPAYGMSDEFNPNFILSDEELQDVKAMDRADILAFLKDQTGVLDNLRTEDKDGNNKLAADIIYQAAKEHNINPKYLLVKLQKEQSLISDSTPTQKQLDGATGYGITDGCGWTCDSYLRNKGFGHQVDSAAGIMRWYYDNTDLSFVKTKNNTYNISGESVTPQSDATAFLYTYTPHIQGNKNFWLIWQKWFKQVYPNGSLVKTENSDTVYLIKEGKKHPFGSRSALITRFDPNDILTVPSSVLSSYPEGPNISFPNYSILQQGSTFYLLDDEVIRPFSSEQVVRSLGFHPDETIQITPSDISSFTIGSTITAETTSPRGELIKSKESGSVYFYKDGKRSLLIDEQIAKEQFRGLAIKTLSSTDLPQSVESDPIVFKDGSLILLPGSNKVYVIEYGKKRHITNEEVFIGMGYKWENIIKTNTTAGFFHPTGQPIYLQQTLGTKEPVELIEKEVVKEIAPKQNDTPTWEDIKAMMVRTPEAEKTYIGKPFETDVDSYLVYDVAAKEIIMGKNIDTVRPTASLAKVMTAYELMQQGLNINEGTTYSANEHKALYHHFRIAEGEKVRNSDLLDAFLTSSLNTPGRMLVDSVEPKESVFISSINNRLDSWGLTNSTFTSVTGEEVDTVTTAREYLTIFEKSKKLLEVHKRLLQKEYRYDELVDIDGKPTHTDTHSNLLANTKGLPYTITGSKTGYLYESGANLAMSIERLGDNKRFIIITMGNVDFHNRFAEPKRLAEYVVSAIE